MKPHDGSCVSFVDVILIQTSLGPSTIIAVRLIDVSFFCADEESSRFVIGEVERGNGDFYCFVMSRMDEFQGFLTNG